MSTFTPQGGRVGLEEACKIRRCFAINFELKEGISFAGRVAPITPGDSPLIRLEKNPTQ